MAGLQLLAVGRLRPHFRAACDDYLARLARYVPVQERELKDAASAGAPRVQQREEARRLEEALAPGARLVGLARDGQSLTSDMLARRVEQWTTGGRTTALLIGGSFGLDPDLLARTDERWSLGPLTLPHELARVVVLEQLYRACTILRGEPYHKGRP